MHRLEAIDAGNFTTLSNVDALQGEDNSNILSARIRAKRTQKQSPHVLTRSPSNASFRGVDKVTHGHVAGSPVNFFRSKPNSNSSALIEGSARAYHVVVPLVSSGTIKSLLQSNSTLASPDCEDPNASASSSSTVPPTSPQQQQLMQQQHQEPLIHRGFASSQSTSSLNQPRPATAIASSSADGESCRSSRCAGCGAYAEVCMACFSYFRKQDAATYKKQTVRSVEVLFEKATSRAFTKMSYVILVWIFGVWKREYQLAKQRRLKTLAIVQRSQLARLWRAWLVFHYERRIIGAMLYAGQQQQITAARGKEIDELHGDAFEFKQNASVAERISQEQLADAMRQIQDLQRLVDDRNQELLALRQQLKDTRERVDTLEQEAIDPKEFERVKNELFDYKKVCFQLASSLSSTMETQVDLLTSSEGRQNLNNVFTKEVMQLLDRPENDGFYNPLAKVEQQEASFQRFDAPTDRADRILIQWANFLVSKQSPEWIQAQKICNFSESLQDGKTYAVMMRCLHLAMCKVRAKRPPGAASKLELSSVLRENGEELTDIAMERYMVHMLKEEDNQKRIELMINTIGQAMWMPLGLLDARDVLAADAEWNFAAFTYLFCTFSPVLDESHTAMCHELKSALNISKSKWREAREIAENELPSNGSPSTSPIVTPPSYQSTSGGITTSSNPSNVPDTSARTKSIPATQVLKLALVQTMDLKKKIDAEEAKAREGHLLWWKSSRIVLRKCFLSFARLARGKNGIMSQLKDHKDENDGFSKIPKLKIQDLSLAFEDFAWETKLLQSYLVTVQADLARIYRAYANRNGIQSETINVGDFTEMLNECRVMDSYFTVTDLHTLVRRVDTKLTSVSNHRVLTPVEFIELLIRVSRKKYSSESHRITMSEAFCLLVDNLILPYAFRADADVFRKQIEDPKIRRLFVKFAEDLHSIYARYSIDDPKKKRKRQFMTAFSFTQCLLDRGVQDVVFTNDKVLKIVARIVSASASASGANREEVQVDEELSYDAFEEALCAVACHKYPDPYMSLESRLEKFLNVYLRQAVPVMIARRSVNDHQESPIASGVSAST